MKVNGEMDQTMSRREYCPGGPKRRQQSFGPLVRIARRCGSTLLFSETSSCSSSPDRDSQGFCLHRGRPRKRPREGGSNTAGFRRTWSDTLDKQTQSPKNQHAKRSLTPRIAGLRGTITTAVLDIVQNVPSASSLHEICTV